MFCELLSYKGLKDVLSIVKEYNPVKIIRNLEKIAIKRKKIFSETCFMLIPKMHLVIFFTFEKHFKWPGLRF